MTEDELKASPLRDWDRIERLEKAVLEIYQFLKHIDPDHGAGYGRLLEICCDIEEERETESKK